MQEPRTSADLANVNHPQLRRRAKRGLVAGYIHEISGRHQHGASRTASRPESRNVAPRSPVAPARQPEAAQLS